MEKRNKVLFITNLHMWSMAANKGGRAFITTVRSYIDNGWLVTVVSTGGGIPDDVRNNARCYETSFPKIDQLYHSNVRVLRLLAKYFKNFACTLFYIRMSKKLNREGYFKKAVIYAYEIESVRASKIISRKYGCPLVTRFQGTIISPIEDTILNRFKFYPHFQALSTPADLIIMTNDGTQGLKTLHRLGNNSNIRFWLNGVSVPLDIREEMKKRARIKCGFNDDFIFLTVSRLVNWKRVDRAINSFAQIANEIPQAMLHIIGDGTAKQSLVEYAKEKGIGNRVIFHGAIEQSQVFDYLMASDVFLSLYDLSNVGNPLLEAMSCGKPIITLDNGDTSLFVRHMDNGIILPINDVGKIPEMMILLYKDITLSSKLGFSARKFAETHFWSWEERMKHELQDVGKLLQ